jgi:hypothetical protein
MPDLSSLSVKERNAEYFHESFDRFYRSGDYTEACMSLWKAIDMIIEGLASFENKEIKTLKDAKTYLQKFVQMGEITSTEVLAMESIYNNRLRSSGDDSILAIHLERTENLFRKLKKILKDYAINGPPKEPTKSAVNQDSSEQGDTLQDSNIPPEQNYGSTVSDSDYVPKQDDNY